MEMVVEAVAVPLIPVTVTVYGPGVVPELPPPPPELLLPPPPQAAIPPASAASSNAAAVR
jgi:hypothetical protein